MTEHAPTPWNAGDIIYLSRAVDVDFAVLAVNSHDDLLVALKGLKAVLMQGLLPQGYKVNTGQANVAMAKADAAIAKAKEKSNA